MRVTISVINSLAMLETLLARSSILNPLNRDTVKRSMTKASKLA